MFRDRFPLLDRFILAEMKGPFLFGVMAFTVLLVAGDLLFDLADLIIEKGVSLGVIARLFVYKLPSVVVLTLPMASLLSALLSFGKLSGDSELAALKASGIAFQRIVRPVLFASILVALSAILMNETVVPLTNRAAENVMRYEVAQNRLALVQDHVFLREQSDGQLKRVTYISRLKPREGLMEGVLVQEFEDGHMRRILSAEKGFWHDGQWWLEKGQVFDVDKAGGVSLLFRFERQKLVLKLTPEQVRQASRKPEEMNAFELRERIELLKTEGADPNPLRVMFHLRLAVPWASVVLALVGASLGVRPQRTSSGMGLGMSVMIVFVYYVTMSFCRALGQSGMLLPAIAAWVPNLLFLLVGAFLIKRANR